MWYWFTYVFRKYSESPHRRFASISSGIKECFSALNRTVICEPRFQSNLPPSPLFLFLNPVYFPLFHRFFFFSSRSLRLAFIPYLIGSDLINFSENAIKRPPGFLPPPPWLGYHLPLLFTPIPKPLRDPSNLSIQMREPTCTPCVVRRIAFYNREVLPRMLVTFPLRGAGGDEEETRLGSARCGPARKLANDGKAAAHVHIIRV